MPGKVSYKNQAEKQSEKERKKCLNSATKELYRAEAGMFHKYFGYKMPSAMLAELVKSNKDDNINFAASIEENLNKLRKDLKNTSDSLLKLELKKIEYLNERIIHLNEEGQQQGHGLKILTPQQMLIRLPISLAQLKARNNSQKLKNELRQLLYSLYRSKKLSKTIYNNLINAI